MSAGRFSRTLSRFALGSVAVFLLRWLWLPLLLVAAGLAIWATHEPPAKTAVPRIAMLSLTPVDVATQEGFRLGLRELGYTEGVDIVLDRAEPAGSIDRLEPQLKELLARQPDLLLVSSTPATQTAQKLTAASRLPVVFAPVNDPLAAGIVTSLATPGGNLTGVRLAPGDAMRLWWLHELAPHVRRVLLPYTPGDRSAQGTLEKVRPLAARLSLTLIERPVSGPEELEQLLHAIPKDTEAIYLPRDSSIEAHVARWVAVARHHKLPLSAPAIAQVSAGALFSYGFQHREIGRQAAHLADQILRGVPPGDLPIETAENILALNLATARIIGLTIPDSALAQAGVVIREQP